MKSRSILIIAAIFIVAIVGVGACSAGLFDFLGGNNSSNSNLTGQEVNLAAAASLKNVYDEKLIPMFEQKYPGVKVTPTYASSGDLQSQIENGLGNQRISLSRTLIHTKNIFLRLHQFEQTKSLHLEVYTVLRCFLLSSIPDPSSHRP